MIEQVLFTMPGERVNLPDFGTGLRNYLFAAQSDETLTAVQFLVEGALNQWLGEVIEVHGVDVRSDESAMVVQVRYRVRDTQRPAAAEFRL
jgi:phage baseplate assembly protein W